MVYLATSTSAHRLSGLALWSLGFLVFGVTSLMWGWMAIAARWLRGRDATLLTYRQAERTAPTYVRAGAALICVGLLLGLVNLLSH